MKMFLEKSLDLALTQVKRSFLKRSSLFSSRVPEIPKKSVDRDAERRAAR